MCVFLYYIYSSHAFLRFCLQRANYHNVYLPAKEIFLVFLIVFLHQLAINFVESFAVHRCLCFFAPSRIFVTLLHLWAQPIELGRCFVELVVFERLELLLRLFRTEVRLVIKSAFLASVLSCLADGFSLPIDEVLVHFQVTLALVSLLSVLSLRVFDFIYVDFLFGHY